MHKANTGKKSRTVYSHPPQWQAHGVLLPWGPVSFLGRVAPILSSGMRLAKDTGPMCTLGKLKLSTLKAA